MYGRIHFLSHMCTTSRFCTSVVSVLLHIYLYAVEIDINIFLFLFISLKCKERGCFVLIMA